MPLLPTLLLLLQFQAPAGPGPFLSSRPQVLTEEEARFWTGEHGVVVRAPMGDDEWVLSIRKAAVRIEPPGEDDDGEGPRTSCPLEPGEELVFAFAQVPASREPATVPSLKRGGKGIDASFTGTFKGEAFTFQQYTTPEFRMSLTQGGRRTAFAASDIFGIVADVAWAGDLDGDGKLDFYIEWSTGLPGPPRRVLYLSTLGQGKRPFGTVVVR